MREYGQIQTGYWGSEDAQSFSDQGKLLCSFLMTGPATNGLGCFPMGDGIVQDYLGWPPEKTAMAFEELSRQGWAYRVRGMVLIPKFLFWNKIANANVAKARFGDFEGIPKGKIRALAARFMLEFCDHWQPETSVYLETVSQTVTETVTETLSQTPKNQNPTQPYPTQPYPTPSVRNRPKREKLPIDASGFDRFYAAYPRKVSKSSALKAFTKLAPSPDLLETMLAALKAQSATAKWRNEPQYIPHPATWINQARWEDDVGAIARTGRMAEPSKTLNAIQTLEARKNANLDRERNHAGVPEAHDLEPGQTASLGFDRRHRDDVV